MVDWSDTLDEKYAERELQQLLNAALEQLKPVDKSAVVLSDMEGMSDKEIAVMLGPTVSAVKTRLHRARLFLRGNSRSIWVIPQHKDSYDTTQSSDKDINQQNLQRDNRPYIRILERYAESVRQTGFQAPPPHLPRLCQFPQYLQKNSGNLSVAAPRRNTGERTP